MTSILDRFHYSPAPFRPTTAQEFFALRLAQKLGDATHPAQYVSLADRHTQATLLDAYREAQKHDRRVRLQEFERALRALILNEDEPAQTGSHQN